MKIARLSEFVCGGLMVVGGLYILYSIVTSVIGLALFIVLLFFPIVIYWLFQIPQSEIASFVLRRAAMLFLGLSAISWFSRESQH